jgi:hypothetical protein
LENDQKIKEKLDSLWSKESSEKDEKDEVNKLIIGGITKLFEWKNKDFPDLTSFLI